MTTANAHPSALTNAPTAKRGRPAEAVQGYRVNVLKPGTRKRNDGNRKADWTCVYISGKTSMKLDALADGNRALACETLRRAAIGAVVRENEAFSTVVIKRATQLLGLYAANLKAQAAENNKAWSANGQGA